MLAFSVAGIGNGLFLVTVRVLMQKLIPEHAHGRAFGLLDAIDSWGFGAAIVAGGALAPASAAARPSPSPDAALPSCIAPHGRRGAPTFTHSSSPDPRS